MIKKNTIIICLLLFCGTTFSQKDEECFVSRDCLKEKSKEELTIILLEKTKEFVNILPWISFDREQKNYGLTDSGNNMGMMKAINLKQTELNNALNTSMTKLAGTRDTGEIIEAVIYIQGALNKLKVPTK